MKLINVKESFGELVKERRDYKESFNFLTYNSLKGNNFPTVIACMPVHFSPHCEKR